MILRWVIVMVMKMSVALLVVLGDIGQTSTAHTHHVAIGGMLGNCYLEVTMMI